jgi:hypothetical protein
VLSRLAPYGGQDFAMSPWLRSQFPEFRPVKSVVDSFPSFNESFERVLDAGAFIYGHPNIGVSLENVSDSGLTIYEIRPVNLQTVCMPSGLLVQVGAEGAGEPSTMTISLDANRPIAMVPVKLGDVPYQPYFQKHTIEIEPDATQVLQIEFTLAQWARAFDIAVSYVSSGRKYTQLIRSARKPFRAMPWICPLPQDRQAMSKEDVRRLAAHRFNEVLVRGVPTPDNLVPLVSVNPDAFAENCMTR